MLVFSCFLRQLMDTKNYYTTGELAKLFNIPKQTMFYYDKMGLLTPEFIAENGYRYYATPQYLTLEIILFLRRLDIPVPDIKKFLQHRSREDFIKILADKEIRCRKTLFETERVLRSVEAYRERLERSQNLPLNQVLLQSFPECRMYLTPIPKNRRGGFDAISIRAKHVREVFAHAFCKDQPTGWVISKEDFFTEKFKHSSAVVTRSGREDSQYPCNFVRPAGLYCSVMIKGAYFLHAKEAYDKLVGFMKLNSLEPDGDVFLFPVVSYWAVNDPDEYINSLSIKVTPPINRNISICKIIIFLPWAHKKSCEKMILYQLLKVKFWLSYKKDIPSYCQESIFCKKI